MMKRTISLLALTGLAVAASACERPQRAPARADLVTETSPCGPRRFEVYFEENQARLTRPALEAIDMTASQLGACDIIRTSVLGLADASGSSEANMILSRRRAEAVAAAFASVGWPSPVMDVAAAGDTGALNEGREEPMRRRAEVLIDAVAR